MERGKWQAVVRRKGIAEAKVFETKGEDQAWARRLETKIESGRFGTGGTLADAMDAYERDVVPHKRGGRWEVVRLNKFRSSLPFVDKPMGRITPADLTAWAQTCGLAPGSIRREASLISSVYPYARRYLGWDVASPIRDAVLPARKSVP